MKLHLWGTDFRRSTPEFRAKLYLPSEKRAHLADSARAMGFRDFVYVPTCNRIEFYTTASDYFSGTRQLWVRLLASFGLGEEAYYQGYHFEGKSALRHLLRVGASLESLVIGENQILGQLKDALRAGAENGIPADPSLERAFSLCFQTAKRIRTETEIGSRPVSVANLGLLAVQRLEAQSPLVRAVVVGRSPICQAVVQWLEKNRPSCSVLWVNRTPESLPIASGSRVERASLSSFLDTPSTFTHLFTSTASAEPIFGPLFFKKLSGTGKQFFDFAHPADIQPCAELDRIGELHTLEGFSREAQENAKARESEVGKAEAIIDDALRTFCREQKEAPLLREFSAAEPRVLEELAEAVLLIEREFPESVQPQVKKWAEKLVRKNWHRSREHLREILHKVSEPTEWLR